MKCKLKSLKRLVLITALISSISAFAQRIDSIVIYRTPDIRAEDDYVFKETDILYVRAYAEPGYGTASWMIRTSNTHPTDYLFDQGLIEDPPGSGVYKGQTPLAPFVQSAGGRPYELATVEMTKGGVPYEDGPVLCAEWINYYSFQSYANIFYIITLTSKDEYDRIV